MDMVNVLKLDIPLDHRYFSIIDNVLVIGETTETTTLGEETSGECTPVIGIPFRNKEHIRRFAQLLISEIDREG